VYGQGNFSSLNACPTPCTMRCALRLVESLEETEIHVCSVSNLKKTAG
jgi:hypothetical protein